MAAATARLAEAGALPFQGERVETLDFTAAVCWLLGLALVIGGVVIVLATAVDALVGRPAHASRVISTVTNSRFDDPA